jgi:hypothetical protein
VQLHPVSPKKGLKAIGSHRGSAAGRLALLKIIAPNKPQNQAGWGSMAFSTRVSGRFSSLFPANRMGPGRR